MELTAILVQVTDLQQGTDKNGNAWKRKTAVFETVEHFPKRVAVTCMNKLCDIIGNYQVGSLLKVQMDAESRYYEGKYYTELRVWNIKNAVNLPNSVTEQAPKQEQAAPAIPTDTNAHAGNPSQTAPYFAS